MANALVAGTMLTVPLSIATSTSNTAGLPLYQFVDSGSGLLPWNAVSLESSIENTTMLGGPHTASAGGASALAYQTTTGDIALYVHNADGTTQFVDLSQQVATPAPGDDPVPFFDPTGAVDVVYVSSTGHVILITPNYTMGARSARLVAAPAYVVTDLSAVSGVTAATGLPSAQVSGETGFVAVLSTSNNLEVIPLAWRANSAVPNVATAANVSSLTGTGTSSSDPVALASATKSFVAISSSGALELFSDVSTSSSAWTVLNLSAATSSPALAAGLTTISTANELYVAGLSASGAVELFSAPISLLGGNLAPRAAPTTTTTVSPSGWSVTNVTGATANGPPLGGQIYLGATSSQISIAGQAQDWGDLFVFSSLGPSSPWTATNVSVTATNAARTVGTTVSGVTINNELVLYAAGVNSPPPQGVGVYAIPSKDWSEAITNGWPIISGTGGLGTQSAPWVGFTSSSTTVATSPDFLMGQSIYNAHKRVTWLSFWTVSGPLAGQPQTTLNYYNHGFAAGAWVATQIDQYRALGVGLKPDWVIFDPEGYPDNSSNLVAPGGASPATLATYATYWTAILSGWAQGIASVDPSLNAGVYANQSEYRNYDLASQPLPVFEAVAFSGNGPVVVAGASGANIRGYIAFSAVCTPTSTLASEMSTLVNPPWSGQFNTLQFGANTYCAPAAT
jgi:hypothetical protein